MAPMLEEEVVIVGAGIAGLATSLALHRLGIRSVVLESASSLRITGFALATWTNAWRALDALGLGDSLRRQHQLLNGLEVTSTITGNVSAEMSFSGSGHEVRCVQRKLLLEAMANQLPDGTIKYSSNVVSMDEAGCFKLLQLSDGTIIKTKVVVGCDGVNSMVAKFLGLNKAAFSGRMAIRGSATFPDGHGYGTKFLLFVGKGFRAGCIPCDDNTIYWFFTWTPSNQEQDLQDSPTKLKEFVLAKLHKTPSIKRVVGATEADRIMSSPLRYRKPWELLWGNISRGNVCVAGDSLHPMTPDIGQGGCSALEDGVVLGRCLGEAILKKKDDVEGGLKRYGKERRWRSIELIATAYLVGRIQQSEWKIATFCRDRVLSKFLAGLLLKRAQYDCGMLTAQSL